ncbi:MAG: MgtC/SapB family protein [Clostridiaceae bacterium]|jgi:putative Mg2+ transporter-C (MgtC) family protein|nr:MgtC/SapB family protein [Clostridiaceae bacterium]
MPDFLNNLRDMNLISMAVRMSLAVICGGLIGLEREHKKRPAGFRTHILICLGACMTTLTGQYLFSYMNYYTDVARLGAQVIAGIGFIGAGNIIVTKRRKVRGLTTAAGLWTAAILGLASGAGYYEVVVAGTILVLLAEIVFSRLEYWINAHAREVYLYVKYYGAESMDRINTALREMNVRILDLEIIKPEQHADDSISAILLLRPYKRLDKKSLEEAIAQLDGVLLVHRM